MADEKLELGIERHTHAPLKHVWRTGFEAGWSAAADQLKALAEGKVSANDNAVEVRFRSKPADHQKPDGRQVPVSTAHNLPVSIRPNVERVVLCIIGGHTRRPAHASSVPAT